MVDHSPGALGFASVFWRLAPLELHFTPAQRGVRRRALGCGQRVYKKERGATPQLLVVTRLYLPQVTFKRSDRFLSQLRRAGLGRHLRREGHRQEYACSAGYLQRAKRHPGVPISPAQRVCVGPSRFRHDVVIHTRHLSPIFGSPIPAAHAEATRLRGLAIERLGAGALTKIYSNRRAKYF
jgi:hypothetical protein